MLQNNTQHEAQKQIKLSNGAIRLGSVKTEQVKRTAKELVKRFPDKFTRDFENNKHLVKALIQGGTPKVRNQIAGYITRFLAAEAEATEEPNETEELQEEAA